MIPELFVTLAKTGYDATQTTTAIVNLAVSGGLTIETTYFPAVGWVVLNELIQVTVYKTLD